MFSYNEPASRNEFRNEIRGINIPRYWLILFLFIYQHTNNILIYFLQMLWIAFLRC